MATGGFYSIQFGRTVPHASFAVPQKADVAPAVHISRYMKHAPCLDFMGLSCFKYLFQNSGLIWPSKLDGFCGIKSSMKRDEIIKTLKEREADLRAHGVTHAALFGSVARGDDRPDSDIDIMVEIAPDARMDVFRYIGIVHMIEDLFPARVDVSNRDAQKPHVRPSAERDAIYAF